MLSEAEHHALLLVYTPKELWNDRVPAIIRRLHRAWKSPELSSETLRILLDLPRDLGWLSRDAPRIVIFEEEILESYVEVLRTLGVDLGDFAPFSLEGLRLTIRLTAGKQNQPVRLVRNAADAFAKYRAYYPHTGGASESALGNELLDDVGALFREDVALFHRILQRWIDETCQ